MNLTHICGNRYEISISIAYSKIFSDQFDINIAKNEWWYDVLLTRFFIALNDHDDA